MHIPSLTCLCDASPLPWEAFAQKKTEPTKNHDIFIDFKQTPGTACISFCNHRQVMALHCVIQETCAGLAEIGKRRVHKRAEAHAKTTGNQANGHKAQAQQPHSARQRPSSPLVNAAFQKVKDGIWPCERRHFAILRNAGHCTL